jgi:hypothetical protein
VIEHGHLAECVPHLALGNQVVLVLDSHRATQHNEQVASEHTLVEDGLPLAELEYLPLVQNLGDFFWFHVVEDMNLLRIPAILFHLVVVHVFVVAHGRFLKTRFAQLNVV